MLVYLCKKLGFYRERDYECTALTNWATGPKKLINYIIVLNLSIKDNKKVVGRVGYAPTTPAMSMQYSTIELTAQTNSLRNS